MTTISDALEREHTLSTAVARFNDLRVRAALACPDDGPADGDRLLARGEALELLALGEVIVRKAGYGRQLDVRAARLAGVPWSQIGSALGTTKQSAWEAHQRWIDQRVAGAVPLPGGEGFSAQDVADARRLAGQPED